MYNGCRYSKSVKDIKTGLVYHGYSANIVGVAFWSCVNANWMSNAKTLYLAKILQKSRQERYDKVLEFKQSRKGIMKERKRNQIAVLYGTNINNQEK